MSPTSKELIQRIVFSKLKTRTTPTTAPLLTIFRKTDSFGISAFGNSHHHLIVGDQIFHTYFIALGRENLGAAGIGATSLQKQKLFTNNSIQLVDIGQKALVVFDIFQQLGMFIGEFFVFQAGQALQAHIQNGLGLNIGKTISLHESNPSRIYLLGAFNYGNNLIYML